MYNLTNLSARGGLVGVMKWINVETGQFFGNGIILAVMMISFLTLKQKYRTKDSLASSLFLTFIFSFLFKTIGMVSWMTVLGSAFGLAGIGIMLYISGGANR